MYLVRRSVSGKAVKRHPPPTRSLKWPSSLTYLPITCWEERLKLLPIQIFPLTAVSLCGLARKRNDVCLNVLIMPVQRRALLPILPSPNLVCILTFFIVLALVMVACAHLLISYVSLSICLSKTKCWTFLMLPK